MTTTTGRRLTLVAIALITVLVVPGAVSAATHNVSIVDFDFNPFEVSIKAGDEVAWTNQAGQQHTVTDNDHNLFNSGPLNPGQTFRHVFPNAGRFGYHCDIHGFVGVVVVAANDGTITTTSTPTTSPSTTSTTQPTPPTEILAGAAFYSDGTSARTGPSGARLSVFATSAEPGFTYRLVSGRGTAQRPCSTDVQPLSDAVKFANATGVIGQTAGTLTRPPGLWQICFLAAGQVVTGAASYTLTE